MRYRPPDIPFYHPTIDLAEQTRRAYASARDAVRTASELVHTSKIMREERVHWQDVWAERIANPERFLCRCVYCGRMRTHSEDWVEIPPSLGRLLQHSNVPFLSHGICPECFDTHLPR
jgi:hypothetical protein